jgi:hypothetical protein
MAIGIGDQGEEQAFLRTKTSAKFNIDMTKPIVAQVRLINYVRMDHLTRVVPLL